MSALDDLIARDSSASSASNGSALDALIARDIKPAPTAASQPAPTSQFSDFANAALHNVQKPFHGLAQLVQNSVAAGANMLPDNPVSRAITSSTASDNAAMQKWEQDYQNSTPNSAGAYAGATVGALAPMFVGGVTRGLQAAGDGVASIFAGPGASILPKIASGATQGAIIGASSPVDNGGNYFDQKADQLKTSALVGGVIPGASSLVSGLYGGVKNAIAPITNPNSVVTTALKKWAGNDAGALTGNPQLVPGSMPTTAQLMANPDIVAAEKTLSNNPAYKGLFAARDVANNDARWAAINNVAQTPQALTDAIATRSAAAKPMQDTLAIGNPAPVDGVMSQLKALAGSALGQRPSIGGAANDILTKIQNLATVDASTGSATIPSAHLDAFRQNVKDYLAKYSPNGAVGTQEQAAFAPVRSAIVDSIDSANPGYRNYLADFAKNSVPINTIEAGQSIVDNLGNRAANAGGTPQLTLAGLSGQLKKATGTQYGISPEAEAALTGVQNDLQRAGISNSIRSPGSDTAYNLQAPNWLSKMLYGSDFTGSKALAAVGGAIGGGVGLSTGGLMGAAGGVTAGGFVGKKLGDLASSRVNGALAQALLNPEIAQGLLAAQPAGQNLALQEILKRLPQAGLLMNNNVGIRQPVGLQGLLQP